MFDPDLNVQKFTIVFYSLDSPWRYFYVKIYKSTNNIISRPFGIKSIIAIHYWDVFHDIRINISSPKMINNYVVLR